MAAFEDVGLVAPEWPARVMAGLASAGKSAAGEQPLSLVTIDQRRVPQAVAIQRPEHLADGGVHLRDEVAVRTQPGPALESGDRDDRRMRGRQGKIEEERPAVRRPCADSSRYATASRVSAGRTSTASKSLWAGPLRMYVFSVVGTPTQRSSRRKM